MTAPETLWVRIFKNGYKQATLQQQPFNPAPLGYDDTEYTRSDLCITSAQADAMVLAERERCARVADAYADENIRMAGDTVLFDPVLKGKKGAPISRDDFIRSEKLILDGAIHSSMFHAAQNIAAAIREEPRP